MSVDRKTVHEVGHHEAKWIHTKRKVIEADRLLSAAELAARVCAALACPYEPHLTAHDDLEPAA